jgi:glycosyltransferase involved in cell wall biosynthesis
VPERGIRRILMTCDTVGGVWTFALELAEGLCAQGIEVVLAALGGNPSTLQEAAAARIPNLCLLGSEFKLEWMEDPWADVEASRRWLSDLVEEYSPDLIHLNTFGHGGLPFSCPVVLTAHSCVLSWWRAIKREPAPPEWNRYRDAVAGALNSASVITAPSQWMAGALEEHYPFDRSLLRVIANGRDVRRFHRAVKEPFVLTAGRLWDAGKNARALSAIAPELEWPVYVAGAGDGLRGCRSLGVLSADDLAGWYARAALYALPARYEPFGLSALEAAFSGCALVLGDIPSLREVWEDAALFVAPEETASLRRALDDLISDSKLRQEMSRRSYERASVFGADRMTAGYIDVYRAATLGRPLCVS